jgi:hypothetical protein
MAERPGIRGSISSSGVRPRMRVKPTSATTDDPKDDKETAAAVDSQYEEAGNGMMQKRWTDLADDFILVTSSGKIYTKPELLEEPPDLEASLYIVRVAP